MAYNITLPNGVTLNTIADGTVDTTTTSLELVGRNYSNYGQYMVNDLVDLLVNFSYGAAPISPQIGQLWYNSTSQVLNVCIANNPSAVWQIVGSATSQPNVGYTTTVAGSFWWDSANQQLYVYNGTTPYSTTGWILVGPQSNNSGAISEQLFDSVGNPHYVLSLYLGGVRTAIISSATFTSNVVVSGFGSPTVIQSGYNMNTSYNIYGTTNNASYLGGIAAANYWNGTANNVGTGSLTLVSNVGITLGTLGTLVANVTTSGTGRLYNTYLGGNVSFHVTSTLSGQEKSLWLSGYDGYVYVNADPIGLMGVATKNYVDNNINGNISAVNASITAANVGMKGYVDNQISATSAAIVTANVGMAGYVNSQINTANVGMIGYVNNQVTTANVGMKGYVDSQFVNTALTGVPTAPTASAGTATTQLATTEFVINNSGFKTNAIYQSNSILSITDTGVGALTLSIDGTTVATASQSGFNLYNGATAVTQSDTYNGTGGTAVATTGFVKNATQWWGNSSSRSAKWVSTSAPNAGVNDVGSNDGDIWFQISS